MMKILAKIVFAPSILLASMTTEGNDGILLPDLGGTSTRVLSAEEEENFPRDFERFMRSNDLLIEDPMITDYFSDMGFRLVAESARPDGGFHFFILRDPNINAFASVSGVIGLHSGLILMARDASEVAGVVAHEIAHVTQDHLARGVENQQQVSLPTMLATLGLALAASAAGSPDAGQAVLLSGMNLAQQFQINHTRQSEAEADRVGIRLLARGGYDPSGMTRFFERLNMYSRSMGDGPPEYLRTHPLTVNRIAEARSRARALDQEATRPDDQFAFVQARLRVLMEAYPDRAVNYFRTRLEHGEGPADAMRYGLVLALVESNRFDDAEANLTRLLDQEPNRQIYRLAKADLELARGHPAVAIEIMADLYRLYPGSRMVTTQYARTLMHERHPGRASRAAEVLRRYLQVRPDDLAMTELYARAAAQSGNAVRAAEAIADSYYLRGGVNEAIEQLERVSERDDLDYYQRARINARLTELRSEFLRMDPRDRN
jgi:predicted Zn-dependent protease